MKHEDIRERLMEYRDGELEASQASEVAAHLPACAECRLVLESWERFSKNILRAAPASEEAFVGRVMARIAEEEREEIPSSRGWWLVPAFAAASVLSLMWWPGASSAAEDPLSEVSWEVETQSLQSEDVLLVESEERP